MGGIAFWIHGFVAKPMLIFMLVAIPPLFVAGGLLVARTGLGAVRVLEGRYRMAWRSFLLDCVCDLDAASDAQPVSLHIFAFIM